MFIYSLYYDLHKNKKKINKFIIIALILFSLYKIFTFLTEEVSVDFEAIIKIWNYFLYYKIFVYLFYKLIGRYWILKYQVYLTKEYERTTMPKALKNEGKRGGFKDSFQAGLKSNFAECSQKTIKKEIEEMKIYLFMFDLKKVDEYVKIHEHDTEMFNTAAKRLKIENFMRIIQEEHMFLKDKYKSKFNEILDDFYKTKDHLRTSVSDYIISDNINFNHILKLLYEYMYYRWRLNINIYNLENQPFIQFYNPKTKEIKMAKLNSPDYKATIKKEVEHISEEEIIKEDGTKKIEKVKRKFKQNNFVLAEDFICYGETEADIWWSNIDDSAKKALIGKGIRPFEVGIRHICGEHVLSLRNGQVAGRTQKLQRDLEEAFVRVTRKIEIPGAPIRCFFLSLFNLFVFNKAKKAKIYQLIQKLKKSGWLKFEVAFSTTEQVNFNAPGVELSKLMDKDTPLYMTNYQTTLVFKISDCWGKYNTHYLEYLADELTKDSKAALLDLPEWNENLKLNKKQILQMNYETGSDLFNIDPLEIYQNSGHYKEIKEERKEKKIKLTDD